MFFFLPIVSHCNADPKNTCQTEVAAYIKYHPIKIGIVNTIIDRLRPRGSVTIPLAAQPNKLSKNPIEPKLRKKLCLLFIKCLRFVC